MCITHLCQKIISYVQCNVKIFKSIFLLCYCDIYIHFLYKFKNLKFVKNSAFKKLCNMVSSSCYIIKWFYTCKCMIVDVWIMRMYMGKKGQRMKYFDGVLKIWDTFLLHVLSSVYSIRDFFNESCKSEFLGLD